MNSEQEKELDTLLSKIEDGVLGGIKYNDPHLYTGWLQLMKRDIKEFVNKI